MASGVYPSTVLVERFQGTVAATTLTQRFIAPCDLDILGIALYVSTAPGTSGTTGLTVNPTVVPTSQYAISTSVASSYALYSTTGGNIPTIANTATTNLTFNTATTNVVVQNRPYALDYPLPGAPNSSTVGFETAQSTSTTTNAGAVVAAPTIPEFGILGGLVAPDNTYIGLPDLTTYNGTGSATMSAAHLHEGDVVSFVIASLTSGLGSSANLEIVLYSVKQ